MGVQEKSGARHKNCTTNCSATTPKLQCRKPNVALQETQCCTAGNTQMLKFTTYLRPDTKVALQKTQCCTAGNTKTAMQRTDFASKTKKRCFAGNARFQKPPSAKTPIPDFLNGPPAALAGDQGAGPHEPLAAIAGDQGGRPQ